MTVKKENIAENFSRCSPYYEEHAFVQKRAALTLSGMLEQLTSPPWKILEIGCGTGFLTGKLLAGFPDASFTICDISEEMLRRCAAGNAGSAADASFVACDALEILDKVNDVDLVVSGLAMQWTESAFPEIIRKIHRKLRPGGTLAFSTLTDKTFSNLKNVFSELGSVYPGPALYSSSAVRSICSVFENASFKEETVTADFDSAFDFLRHIKMTGAGNASGHAVSPAVLRKVINRLANGCGGTLRAEYHLLFCLLEKNAE